jgi:hypothetical protein
LLFIFILFSFWNNRLFWDLPFATHQIGFLDSPTNQPTYSANEEMWILTFCGPFSIRFRLDWKEEILENLEDEDCTSKYHLDDDSTTTSAPFFG